CCKARGTPALHHALPICSSAGSLSAHRITQSFSSFVLGRIDSPNGSDSGKALSMDRRQFEQMHGRKSSFSSAPPTPLRSPSETRSEEHTSNSSHVKISYA